MEKKLSYQDVEQLIEEELQDFQVELDEMVDDCVEVMHQHVLQLEKEDKKS